MLPPGPAPSKTHPAAAAALIRQSVALEQHADLQPGPRHSTRSLLSTDLTHVVENGRTYPNDTYYMPCDGLEQTRLEILHRLYLTALDGALTTAPLSPGIQRVLDVGTGPGEWASQMAEQFPDAEIVAVDLAVWELPAREAAVDSDEDDSSCDDIDPKANVIWEIDDLEPYSESSRTHSPVNPSSTPALEAQLASVTADVEGLTIDHDQGYASGSTTAEGGADDDHINGDTNKTPASPPSSSQKPHHPQLLGAELTVDDGWNFSEPFDFVHVRDLKGAFRDWRAVYREAFTSLAPGGLLEVVEVMPDLSTISPPSPSSPCTTSANKKKSKRSPAAAASCSSSTTSASAVRTLVDATVAAAAASGRPLSLDHILPESRLLEDAGFCDVRRRCVDVPMGPHGIISSGSSGIHHHDDDHHHHSRLASLGKMWLVVCAEGLEASCLRLLTRHAGWTPERVRAMVKEARREILEGRCGGVVTKAWFVTARKKGGAGVGGKKKRRRRKRNGG
ncbi:tam domain methyltransferase [Diplodia corticola]|uniref:Tam domain methyltransferase n=1 Tax=Diplodia corticola TaxID=236234 RepID=A0A1J9REV1_9PEZI|nr:tam domain methyltransferase [Diplodia corticola]OJD38929.1 tam domain methyltransferase [Diplodia corticola]